MTYEELYSMLDKEGWKKANIVEDGFHLVYRKDNYKVIIPIKERHRNVMPDILRSVLSDMRKGQK